MKIHQSGNLLLLTSTLLQQGPEMSMNPPRLYNQQQGLVTYILPLLPTSHIPLLRVLFSPPHDHQPSQLYQVDTGSFLSHPTVSPKLDRMPIQNKEALNEYLSAFNAESARFRPKQVVPGSPSTFGVPESWNTSSPYTQTMTLSSYHVAYDTSF